MTPVLLRLHVLLVTILHVNGMIVSLPAVQLDDDLAVAVVVDLLELANVACALHVSECRE